MPNIRIANALPNIRSSRSLSLTTLVTSTSATSPGTMADDSSIGTIIWLNPDNAKVSDAVYATINGAQNSISHYLKATNFGFSIPIDATISGITVEIQKQKGAVDGDSTDNSVKLVKGGVISGNDKADTVNPWPSTEAYTTYGSSSDIWGLTLSPADINASNFGVVISGKITNADISTDGSIDHIRITVSYLGVSTIPAEGPIARLNNLISNFKVSNFLPNLTVSEGGATSTTSGGQIFGGKGYLIGMLGLTYIATQTSSLVTNTAVGPGPITRIQNV